MGPERELSPIRPPDPARFSARSYRLQQLALTHSHADYLGFMALLAQAQGRAARDRAPPALDPAALELALRAGLPPIPLRAHRRDPLWRADVAAIAGALRAFAPGALVERMDATLAAAPEELEAGADRLLGDSLAPDEATRATFVGAALQVYFGRLAMALPDVVRQLLPLGRLCPVCGSRPVASVVRLGPDGARVDSLRYLHCALCETEWEWDRGRCSACDSVGALRYWRLNLAGRSARTKAEIAPVRAESCDDCKTYLKILYFKADPQVDPLADDRATLALDEKMQSRHFRRSGPAVLFQPGRG